MVLADFLDTAVAPQASPFPVDQFDAAENIFQNEIGILVIAVDKTFGIVVGIEPHAVHCRARLQYILGLFAISLQKKERIAEINRNVLEPEGRSLNQV